MKLSSSFLSSRRSFLAMVTMMALAPAACAKALDAQVWDKYRQAFIAPDGRVMDTGNGNISHSEGQGFGLLMALAANDRTTFEAIFNWTETHLTRADSGLYAWKFDPAQSPPVSDPNNATDGDVLIAWALIMAADQWNKPEYATRSETMRAAILREVVVSYAGKRLLLPGRIGFANDAAVVLNLSYYVWPALDTFAGLEPMWSDIINDGLDLLAASSFGPWHLPTDWSQIDAAAEVSPAAGRPARFGYDAVRVPLYLAWSSRTSDLIPFQRYWGETEKANGWPAWIDVVTGETAPYPASEGMVAIARLTLNRNLVQISTAKDYYSESLVLLSILGQHAAKGR